MRDNSSAGKQPVATETTDQHDGERARVSAGHLSVHVAENPSREVPFLFERQPKRMGGAFAVSFLLQAGVIALAVLEFGTGAVSDLVTNTALNDQIIWLTQEGPGGGGGGGGNQMKEPPKQAELPGKDKITVPVETPAPAKPQPEPKVEPNPVEQLSIPAMTLASAATSTPGTLEAPPGPPTPSLGSGSGGGAGTGTGTGIGPGRGSGLGPGSGGGTGGGNYRPGSGVSFPVKIKEVKPAYTSDAMRAKVQGTVLLSCVVREDGTVGDIEVVRSLDSTFGLDQEAIKAARQWLFRPSIHQATGRPVPVEITIELSFNLR